MGPVRATDSRAFPFPPPPNLALAEICTNEKYVWKIPVHKGRDPMELPVAPGGYHRSINNINICISRYICIQGHFSILAAIVPPALALSRLLPLRLRVSFVSIPPEGVSRRGAR